MMMMPLKSIDFHAFKQQQQQTKASEGEPKGLNEFDAMVGRTFAHFLILYLKTCREK